MSDKLKIIIDGKEVECEKGETILGVAERIGVKIPHLCYHKALPPYGACRLCVVEVEEGVKAACTYEVKEGLEVKTNTPKLHKVRSLMVELLLARCPKSEELKRIAEELGVKETRFPKMEEDCILCGLCVRMCEYRMKRGVLSFKGRGVNKEVNPVFDVHSPLCQVCGACYFVCPTKGIKFEEITKNKPKPLLSEFDRGLRERSSIYIPFPQAVPNYAIIDKEHCVHLQTGECRVCEEFCEAGAIDFEQKEKKIELNVGSVIVAPGYELFEPKIKHALGYKKYPNVITSGEFERILSPSGPYGGHIKRPSDLKEPKKIAFIQCVGSRDTTYEISAPYCSGVCCMHSIKEAIIAKEHVKDIEATIFYMDMRAYGKEFDKYYERAEKEYEVKFVRSKVDRIEEKEDKNLIVYYTDAEGKLNKEEFELIILAVGFRPPKEVEELADKLGVRLNVHKYLEEGKEKGLKNQLLTTREGIFACGVVSGPKDIPETVMQASGAVANVGEILGEVRGTEVVYKEYPKEKEVKDKEPRIGVFVCNCGINIGGIVDVPSVVEYVKTLPNVVYAEENLFTCSQDTQKKIKETIENYDLNRIVVASCTPRTHEPLFQETLKEAGLNPRLFEMANIRDQCSWIHMNEPELATQKAKELVKMSVAKVRLLEPLPTIEIDVIQKAVVIGGGIAGMTAALSIGRGGFPVVLLEKEKQLGGNLRKIYYTIKDEDVQEFLEQMIKEVEECENVEIYTGVKITSIEGYVGNYKTKIRIEGEDEEKEIEHGAVVVAVGGEEGEVFEYLYKEDEKVITQLQLEKLIHEKEEGFKIKGKKPKHQIDEWKDVVMIQCVGSREEERNYCSRVCCQESIKNAIKLKKINPKINVYVLYRDVRTYGFFEEYYQKAREVGVVFVRYEKENKPKVKREGEKLEVKLPDPVVGETLVIHADRVVIAPPIVPQQEVESLAKMLKVPLTEDKFFLEAHVKLRPVDFATEGIFLAGLAHSPKTIEESIAQAKAASARVMTIISKPKYEAEAIVASVDEELCSGCGICETVCPYDGVKIVTKEDKRVSEVTSVVCKGCGNCSAACPSGAMQQLGFKRTQLQEMVERAVERE